MSKNNSELSKEELQFMQDVVDTTFQSLQIDYMGIHRRAVEILGHAIAIVWVSANFVHDLVLRAGGSESEVVYETLWVGAMLEMQDLPAERSVLQIDEPHLAV